MSDFDEHDPSTRPYTVGVSIAVLLIFLIALFHVWKFIFKKVKKWLNPTQLEAVITEIPFPDHGDRKLSTDCIEQLEMIIRYEKEFSEINRNPKRAIRYCRSLSENSGKVLERKRSVKRKRNSVTQQNIHQYFVQPSSTGGITFLAGYSHRHVNEG